MKKFMMIQELGVTDRPPIIKLNDGKKEWFIDGKNYIFVDEADTTDELTKKYGKYNLKGQGGETPKQNPINIK